MKSFRTPDRSCPAFPMIWTLLVSNWATAPYLSRQFAVFAIALPKMPIGSLLWKKVLNALAKGIYTRTTEINQVLLFSYLTWKRNKSEKVAVLPGGSILPGDLLIDITLKYMTIAPCWAFNWTLLHSVPRIASCVDDTLPCLITKRAIHLGLVFIHSVWKVPLRRSWL